MSVSACGRGGGKETTRNLELVSIEDPSPALYLVDTVCALCACMSVCISACCMRCVCVRVCVCMSVCMSACVVCVHACVRV